MFDLCHRVTDVLFPREVLVSQAPLQGTRCLTGTDLSIQKLVHGEDKSKGEREEKITSTRINSIQKFLDKVI